MHSACFNLCPDEKGTESLTLSHLRLPPIVVSTFAPTKRGLKVSNMLDLQPSSRIVSTLAPMKRGLKDDFSVPYRDTTNGFNPCPDEKGTESIFDLFIMFIRFGFQPLPRRKGD